MEPIRVKTHVGEDGILRLELPVGVADVDCEVTIQISSQMTQVEWRAFLEETAGSLADDPIERGDQGEYEVRDELR